MVVPALPSRASTALSRLVIMVILPGLLSTNLTAASTLGSIEPGRTGLRPCTSWLRYGKFIQILLIGFLVVDAYLFYSGKYNQSIGIQILRQLLACKILIYNGGCAFQLTLIVAYYRDTASAYGDDYEAVVNQAFYCAELLSQRALGSNYSPPAAARVFLHYIALLVGNLLGFFLGIEWAYRLGGF